MIRYSAFSQKGATKKNNEDRVMVENRIINDNTQSGFSNNSLIAITNIFYEQDGATKHPVISCIAKS